MISWRRSMMPNQSRPMIPWARCNRAGGQSLVELALIIPLIFFVLLTYFQLVMTCHNAITLQAMVAETARANALQENDSTKVSLQALLRASQLLGKVIPPRSQRSTTILSPWRPFKGLECSQSRGYLL